MVLLACGPTGGAVGLTEWHRRDFNRKPVIRGQTTDTKGRCRAGRGAEVRLTSAHYNPSRHPPGTTLPNMLRLYKPSSDDNLPSLAEVYKATEANHSMGTICR